MHIMADDLWDVVCFDWEEYICSAVYKAFWAKRAGRYTFECSYTLLSMERLSMKRPLSLTDTKKWRKRFHCGSLREQRLVSNISTGSLWDDLSRIILPFVYDERHEHIERGACPGTRKKGSLSTSEGLSVVVEKAWGRVGFIARMGNSKSQSQNAHTWS